MINNNNNNFSDSSEYLEWISSQLIKLLKDKKFNKLLKNLEKEESPFKGIFINILPAVEAFGPNGQLQLPFKTWTTKTAINQLASIGKKYDATIKYKIAESLYEGIYGSQSEPKDSFTKIKTLIDMANFDFADFAYYIQLLASQGRVVEFRDLLVELMDLMDEAVSLYRYKSNGLDNISAGDLFHQQTNQMRPRFASELQSVIYDNCERISKIVSQLFDLGVCPEPSYSLEYKLGLTPDYDFLHEQKLIQGTEKIANLIFENDRHLEILKRFAEYANNSANFIKNKKEHLKLTIENIDQRLVDLEKVIDTTYQELNELIELKRSFQQHLQKKKTS